VRCARKKFQRVELARTAKNSNALNITVLSQIAALRDEMACLPVEFARRSTIWPDIFCRYILKDAQQRTVGNGDNSGLIQQMWEVTTVVD